MTYFAGPACSGQWQVTDDLEHVELFRNKNQKIFHAISRPQKFHEECVIFHKNKEGFIAANSCQQVGRLRNRFD